MIKLNYFNKTNFYIKKHKITIAVTDYLNKKLPNQNLELGIHFVNLSTIKKLNNRYRLTNKPTDVLSFPLYNSVKTIQDHHDKLANIGDIYICPDFIQNDCVKLRINFQDHIVFLSIHGLKHLIGFHHK